MRLIKKSRRMLSGIFHVRPISDYARMKPRPKSLLSRRRKFKRRTSSSLSVARRTMDMFICRGEKRKREEVDDSDDAWECKKRFVRGCVSHVVAEEDFEREEARYEEMPCSPSFHCAASDVEPGELPDDYEELLEKVHSNLENLTITDADDSLPSTQQTSPEPHTNLDWAWLEGLHDWENRYRARRCHSETSTRILSYANAVTGDLPDGSGRRSAPPNLDTAWSVDRRPSLGSASALSEAGTLEGVFDESAALELVLFAESEAGDDVEVGREEDVDAHAEEEEEDEEETQVAGESAGQREPKAEPSPDPISEHEEKPASTQTTDPPSKPASPPTEPISELTFRMKYDSLMNWGLDTLEVDFEPRVCKQEVTAEDVAGRIRAVKAKMMEGSLDIEHRLRPHCSGTRY